MPSFLSALVVWFVSGRSHKFVAAKLAFSPFSTPCGGTVSGSLCAILIEFGHMSCVWNLNVLR